MQQKQEDCSGTRARRWGTDTFTAFSVLHEVTKSSRMQEGEKQISPSVECVCEIMLLWGPSTGRQRMWSFCIL